MKLIDLEDSAQIVTKDYLDTRLEHLQISFAKLENRFDKRKQTGFAVQPPRRPHKQVSIKCGGSRVPVAASLAQIITAIEMTRPRTRLCVLHPPARPGVSLPAPLMKKPTPENVRLRSLNAQLLKALETARSYIDACAPADSQQRAWVLHEIDAAIASTRSSKYPGELDALYKHAAHYELATRCLQHEQYVTEKALRKIAAVAARTFETLEAGKAPAT
jgi:hypothetical protein